MKSCHIGEARGDAQGETHVWSSEGVVSSLGGQTPPGRYSDRKHWLVIKHAWTQTPNLWCLLQVPAQGTVPRE